MRYIGLYRDYIDRTTWGVRWGPLLASIASPAKHEVKQMPINTCR